MATVKTFSFLNNHTFWSHYFRDEQYRQMWAELEKFVRAHSDTSPYHEKVLECLLECKKPSAESASPKKGKAAKEAAVADGPASPDPATAWTELDR